MGSITSLEGCIMHGPWGGSCGRTWICMPKSFIAKIVIIHGEEIHAIKFDSYNGGDSAEYSPFFGCQEALDKNTATKTSIDFQQGKEYLTSISGTYSESEGLIKSLSFDTNHASYGPYGSKTGTSFSYNGNGGVIVGFHGFVDKRLHAIGVYIKPESLVFAPYSTDKQDSVNEQFQDAEANLDVHEPDSNEGSMSVGCWGGSGGEYWSYKPIDGLISQILLVHGSQAIQSIMFKTVNPQNGSSRYSPWFGGSSIGIRTDKIDMNIECEYLTEISGTYGYILPFGPTVVRSLRFTTNIAHYGPFGIERGTSFQSLVQGGVIVGFKGNCGDFLDAIGVHMVPISTYMLHMKNKDDPSLNTTKANDDKGEEHKGESETGDGLSERISSMQDAIENIRKILEAVETRLIYINLKI